MVECRDCFGYQNGNAPDIPNKFCIRHRCTKPGCKERRVAPVTLRDITWLCDEHSDLDMVMKFMDLNNPTQPMMEKPSENEPIDPNRTCEVCIDEVKGIKRSYYYKPRWFCVQHRCTNPSCVERRGDRLHPRHDLGTSTWNAIYVPPRGVPSQPAPPARRHSRIRSLFSWKSRGNSRRDEANDAAGEEDRDSGTNPVVQEASKVAEVPVPPVVTTPAPPVSRRTPIPISSPIPIQKPFDTIPNWHQCHAPACQDKVINEFIWVCHKHFTQGFYQLDDPPGFMDAPANHTSP